MKGEKEQAIWRYAWTVVQEGTSVSEKPWGGNELGIHGAEKKPSVARVGWMRKAIGEEAEWTLVSETNSWGIIHIHIYLSAVYTHLHIHTHSCVSKEVALAFPFQLSSLISLDFYDSLSIWIFVSLTKFISLPFFFLFLHTLSKR